MVTKVRLMRDTSGVITFNAPVVFSSGDIFRLTFAYDMG